MTSGTDPVDELFAELIAALEEDPRADVECFLAGHATHAAALRKRIEKLRAAGFLGPSPQAGNLLHEMRERFGVRSGVRTLPASRENGGPGQSELLPSRVIGGRYRILGELGRGGMGRVFRALDVDLDREVALKVADLEEVLPGAGSPQKRIWIERFLSEAQVTAQLEHPSIVPVHDIGIDRTGQLFYTMKVVEGETLARCIDDWHRGLAAGRPFPTAELLRVVLQICNALAFAHERGVIHRDLKPSNVMVGRFGEVQVMDWGLSKLLGDSEAPAPPVRSVRRDSGSPTRAGDVLGTPTHMAPEQAHGDPNAIDFRSDVFGIGAILHHAVYGSPPNRVGEASDRTRGFSVSWKVPAELEAICQRALQTDPRLRYTSASKLAVDLRAYLDERVVTAYETGPWAELRKWIRRNRGFAAAVASGILALLSGLVVSLILRSEAVSSRDEVLRLSALQDLDDLVDDADQLWPAHPRNIERFVEWIDRAKALVAELPKRRSQRQEFETAMAQWNKEPAASHVLDQRETRWWSNQLTKLIKGLEGLSDPATGLLAADGISAANGWSVPKRLSFALRTRDGFADGGECFRAWAEALPAIRLVYPGLDLPPQPPLVPLGLDPVSGLWEFADVQTGDVPKRSSTGRLLFTENSGIVFVLLPGGAFLMGSQSKSPGDPNYDPYSESGDVHKVVLPHFFLSKYEMTQAQWLHVTGQNPSHANPATYKPTWNSKGRPGDLLHPVEVVNWLECVKVLGWMGFSLPSEAQWEYGARAGTTSLWWTGMDRESLRGAANIADASCLDMDPDFHYPGIEKWLNDGNACHAHVGSYQPNLFGLFDVHGNVWEWCLDDVAVMKNMAEVSVGPVPGQGRDGKRPYRGGGFNSAAYTTRSGGSYSDRADYAVFTLGLRPAMSIKLN